MPGYSDPRLDDRKRVFILSVDVNACDSYTWITGDGNTYTTSGLMII
jgi:hypothetical protein